MSKMCSLSKVMRSTNGESYVSLMNNPKFYCKRCGRAANEKEYLCRPTLLVDENTNELKIKEIELNVTRDGAQKHYFIEKEDENLNNNKNKVIEEEFLTDSSSEDTCNKNCDVIDSKIIHVSDLFKNADGTFSDDWEDGNKIQEDFSIEDSKDFISNDLFLNSTKTNKINDSHSISSSKKQKKDKKIKKLKISDLREIIKEEIRIALEKK